MQPYTKGGGVSVAKTIAGHVHKGTLTEATLKQVLNDHGISYSVVRKLDKTPIDAVSMMTGETPAIITTHRYNDMSRLVFNVLHELGHVELHFNGNDVENLFISSDETYSLDNKQEKGSKHICRRHTHRQTHLEEDDGKWNKQHIDEKYRK